MPPELWHDPGDDEESVYGSDKIDSDDESDDLEYDIETSNTFGVFAEKRSTDVQSPVGPGSHNDSGSADVFGLVRPS